MYKRALGLLVVFGSVAGAEPTKQPTLTFETPTITGKLDAKVLTSTIKRSRKKLLDCYAKEYAKDKLIASAVANATFTIGNDGKLSNVAVSVELPKSVETCIADVLSAIRFAKRKGDPVEVTFPLAFSPPTMQGGAFASITGTGDISSGFDDKNIYGGLTAEGGWGTIGTGSVGSGGGTGSGYGVGRGGMRGRSAAVPTMSIGQPEVKGDLDKAIIRRYVKRNINKLQYCYEKELLKQPKLAGTSTVEFVIGVDGIVSSSTASGLDANVDACIADVIKGIEFPKPKGGGAVSVRYPLTVRPAETQPAKKP